ncbi:hypothetical protein L873DRAFT_1665964, partial [Choiromyces venosus 120613-1]
WADIIWSDECSICVGDVSGTGWVTCRPGEEYLEDCLVPKFAKQTTIMIWGCIYCDLKELLVIWDLANWGRINGTTYVNKIIHPHLHPWWTHLQHQQLTNLGYIYFQHDGATAHHAKYTTAAFEELGMGTYIMIGYKISSSLYLATGNDFCFLLLVRKYLPQLHFLHVSSNTLLSYTTS